MNTSPKLACGGLALLLGSFAYADTDVRQSNVADEPGYLTVYAPRVVRRPDRRAAHANNELVSIANRVSYAGLDLAMHADVLELRKRIVEGAQTGCEQLAALLPMAQLDTAECVREAIDDAMARARQVVAAAMAAHEAE